MGAEMKICAVESCDEVVRTAGYCNMHYQRFLKFEDPLGGGTFKSKKGESLNWLKTLIDTEIETCIIWPYGTNGAGYGMVHVEGKHTGAHRVMCEMVYGPPPEPKGSVVRHLCGKGHDGCVNPRHLLWGTKKENAEDRKQHSTHAEGQSHPLARLTEEDVLEIRKRIDNNEKKRSIAEIYGVSEGHIGAIGFRKVWRHI